MQYVFLIIFLVGSFWDGLTTALGVATVIGANDSLSYATCFVAGLLVLGFSIFTKTIWIFPGLIGIILKLVWIFAITFDFYTSFIGNAKYIVLQNLDTISINVIFQTTDPFQLFVLIGLTVMVSISPIILSVIVL